MTAQLKTQITKLRAMAQLVISECDKTEAMMDKPVSKRTVNKEKRLAIKEVELMKRWTAKRGLVKQS